MKKLEEKIGRNENVLENIEGEEIELPLNFQGDIEKFEIKLKKKDFVNQMVSVRSLIYSILSATCVKC